MRLRWKKESYAKSYKEFCKLETEQSQYTGKQRSWADLTSQSWKKIFQQIKIFSPVNFNFFIIPVWFTVHFTVYYHFISFSEFLQLGYTFTFLHCSFTNMLIAHNRNSL